MKKFLLIAACLTFGILGFFFWLEQTAESTKNKQSETVVFEVLAGDDAFTIGTRLENEELVHTRYAFLWNLARERKLHSFVAGRYRLAPHLTVAEIAGTLTGGGALSRDIRLTFPEGFTAVQIAERVSASGLPGTAVQDLIEQPKAEWRTEFSFLSDLPEDASLEGYLFPDTYFFAPDADAETIVTKLLQTFETKVTPALQTALAQKVDGLHRAITLASIVEHEVRSPEDRKLVSDLFLRRLAIGQALQSDATVKYILGEDKIKHSIEETRTPSLYNTYLHPGLPPGPISNPGLVSLESVAYPTPNAYFYFLNNPDTGATVFAETFDEHIRNKGNNGL